MLRDELWHQFHDLAKGGTTLLVSSHVMDEAARCDRLLLIRDGDLIADDTPDAIRSATGTGDLEEAFLRLIRAREGGPHEAGPHDGGPREAGPRVAGPDEAGTTTAAPIQERTS